MGANAQRRRTVKASVKPGPATRPSPYDTKTMQRLRTKMAQVRTKVQVEEMILDAHPSHRPAVRDLLYSLIDPTLPCCGIAMLSRVRGDNPVQHANRCPVSGLVVLS